MAVTIYLQGMRSADGQQVSLPLSSCAVLMVVAYTHPSTFHLAFVSSDHGCSLSEDVSCVTLPHSGLSSLDHEFISARDVPLLVSNVALPSVLDSAVPMVRSGLCVVVRHIVRVAHAADPSQDLLQLLGFRQGSLRMCAEVSGWTKLCEVELPLSVTALLHQIYRLSDDHSTGDRPVTLPADLMKLEAHLQKPVKVHNDDRRRRSELAALHADMKDPEQCADIVLHSRLQGSQFVLERGRQLPHGWRKIRVEKEGVEVAGGERAEDCGRLPSEGPCLSDGEVTVEQVRQVMESLSYLDVHFLHLYAEGTEMTIADLCLFPYLYFLLECVQFRLGELAKHLPHVTAWLSHMVTLPRLRQAASRCSFHLPPLQQPLQQCSPQGGKKNSLIEGGKENSLAEGEKENSLAEGEKEKSLAEGGKENSLAEGEKEKSLAEGGKENSLAEGEKENSLAEGGKKKSSDWIYFCTPSMDDMTEDDMELSRRCRTKHRALKPEVQQALSAMKSRGIEPEVGSHPRGSDVTLDWDNLPSSIHPKEGEVPAQRVQRKCQQLENLVTAVMEVARPGDVVVDFCSGGGHLGLPIAHLLPDCTVYLVENKEESLVKAVSRMEAMATTNVVLYQCNMDYFTGRFDVGVCLHACGSATDMVLQQCLHNQAAFVICPCCYGSIQQTHLLTYPRSRLYQDRQVTYKEFLTLGHAADQTEFKIALEQQGRQCMNLVDSDRAHLAHEAGYTVTLTSLQPLTCSPKNNLLIGRKHGAASPS